MSYCERDTIESEFFTCTGWDEIDTGSFYFYDCVLRKTIGDFPVGTKLHGVLVDFKHSAITLQTDGVSETTYALGLKIGEKLS